MKIDITKLEGWRTYFKDYEAKDKITKVEGSAALYAIDACLQLQAENERLKNLVNDIRLNLDQPCTPQASCVWARMSKVCGTDKPQALKGENK